MNGAELIVLVTAFPDRAAAGRTAGRTTELLVDAGPGGDA